MTPEEILDSILATATASPEQQAVADTGIRENLEYVCKCISNRAGIRLLMSCLLAKVHRRNVDPREPYTEIDSVNSFSGRTYDERYLTHFINENQLPCNVTTAFLTPALRNIDRALTTDLEIVGRPREVYTATLQLLDDVHNDRAFAGDLLTDAVRILIQLRDEKLNRMDQLIKELKEGRGAIPLSSEQIVTLIQQHLACKGASRLAVLVVAAAYKAAANRIGECSKPLLAHNAADLQTKALGDVEICLTDDENVATAYEMKMKRVMADDIDAAVQKIVKSKPPIHNYIFITTDVIDPLVVEHAASFYEKTGGTEIAILDCIGFTRHFLHFFHRLRVEFLQEYQDLVLGEPDSAVSQPLKEAFLALRKAAESNE
ncbi:restriction endonuclease, SacI family [Neptuniibacter sp.]|uniref:restriction endonuclease, SacI family n=1 Tax=Neptuniibacter sp. TaxID=1962643 RepID=UPI00261D1D55|nr:restriction endonuclease, SacI family [Neptuniibacter sp.]MCP4598632.1 restriction endonuclease, SacI family [Neptuniibacter sp.]